MNVQKTNKQAPTTEWMKCGEQLPEKSGDYLGANVIQGVIDIDGFILAYDAASKTWKDWLGRDAYPQWWKPIPETSPDNLPTSTKGDPDERGKKVDNSTTV